MACDAIATQQWLQEREVRAPYASTISWEMLRVEESLNMVGQMDDPPSVEHFICILQKCRKGRDPLHARAANLHIHGKGLEFLSELGNYIVPMFTECGRLPDAQQMFNRMAYPNVYAWTSLIHAYTVAGNLQRALTLYHQMQAGGIPPSLYTFLSLVKSCATHKCIERGQEMHAEVAKEGFEGDLFLCSALVDMYAKCGLLTEAQDVFNQLPTQDVVLWNALLSGYAEYGCCDEVLSGLEKMQHAEVSPDCVTFICSLKAFASTGAIEHVFQIHTHIVKSGFEQATFVGNTLLDAYAKLGSVSEARAVFGKLQVQDVVPWTALISCYAQQGLSKEVLTCLEMMQCKGVSPNVVTYICSLKTCAIEGDVHSCEEIHAMIVKEGYEDDPVIANVLVDAYAKCGFLVEALDVFTEQPIHDVVAWTALIGGHAEHGLCVNIFDYLEQMQLEGVSPDDATFACSLKACTNLLDLKGGQELHSYIVRTGLDLDPSVSNALVDMYAKCGAIKEAHRVFDLLPSRNVVSWNTLVIGYVDHGLSEVALKLVEQMQFEGLSPDPITFCGCLKACNSLSTSDIVQGIHLAIVTEGYEKDVSIGNTLVDVYGKYGWLVEAKEVFDELEVRDVVSWTTLICGYSEHGFGEEALHCLQEMHLEGVTPNAITFDCSLKCCGSLQAIDRGLKIHCGIIYEGFELDPYVGNAMVDMYAKCGLMSEAQAVFDELPSQHIVSWNALVWGYAKCGYLVEAQDAFDAMPTQDVFSWSALISGYSDHGLGEEALNCFHTMQQKGFSPDIVTLSCALKACGCLGTASSGLEMHQKIAQEGFEQDHIIGNSLVSMYTKCGMLAEAQKVFDGQLSRDVVSWTALITGYGDSGFCEKALEGLEQMQLEGISPNIISWNALILGFAEEGDIEKCVVHLLQMQEQGLPPSSLTFINVLKAVGKTSTLTYGERIHAQIKKIHDFEVEEATLETALIDMYGKCCRMRDAQQLFDALPGMDIVRWNALITGYARQGEIEQVLTVFEKMRGEGLQPNGITFLSLIVVCSHVGLVDMGLNYFKLMWEEYSVPPIRKHYNCMVDLLSRAGKLHFASRMLKIMSLQPDIVTWRTLLSASQKWKDMDFGREAFMYLVNFEENYSSPFILMSNIIADPHTWLDTK